MHVRAQVRREMVARLEQSAAITAAGVRHIVGGRVWPWHDAHLPAISVHVREEEIEIAHMGGVQERRMTVVVEAAVEASVSPDDLLDEIGAAVEAAVTEPAGMDGLCLDLQAVRIDVGRRAEVIVGVISHEYEARVMVARDAPAVIM